jgi:hypothetical protein
MSIKTNHTQDSLAPESGVLKVAAVGAIGLPAGAEAERPNISAAGYVRFASEVASPEYYDGTNWQFLTSKEYVDSRVGNAGESLSDVIANLKLNDLTDVTIQSQVDSQILAYDITLGQFINKSQAMSIVTRLFQGDGSALTFDILTSVGSIQNLVVSINGIQQEPFYSYTLVDGHIVAFDEAPEAGDRIQVKILNSTVSTDRARPKILNISYGEIAQYTTITIVGTDIPYGTGAKIGSTTITRIDYPVEGTMQLMVESSRMSGILWQYPQSLTLVDTSGNEFSFPALIHYGATKPKWTNSSSYIGSYQGGNAIDFELGVQNATSFSISPAYTGESALTWLSVSNGHIVGVAPQNSSPSRYEFTVTATDGIVNITKNFWLLVV